MEARPGDHLETELKFEAAPGFILPDLGGLASGLVVSSPAASLLIASYYDTSDLRLAAAGITLRRRTGGSDEGWHLKLPVAESTRRELHEPLGDGEAVPPRFQAAVAEWTGHEQLGVVAVLQTRRTVRNLAGADGEVAAELADDVVTGTVCGSGDAPAGSITWREIEVELVTGGADVLAAAAARLTAAGATRSSSSSKLARLLGSQRQPG